MNEKILQQEILRVAVDIYERSGRIKGRDFDNWLEAERIVRTLREIVGDDSKGLISINVPRAGSDEEGEYSKWMIKFLKR